MQTRQACLMLECVEEQIGSNSTKNQSSRKHGEQGLVEW